MPTVLIKTNVKSMEDREHAVMKECSLLVSELTNKPENFVLVSMETSKMIFGGTADPCAFVFLASLGGIGPANNPTIVKAISGVLGNLGIPPNRIYVQFDNVKDRHDFGWNGTTFG